MSYKFSSTIVLIQLAEKHGKSLIKINKIKGKVRSPCEFFKNEKFSFFITRLYTTQYVFEWSFFSPNDGIFFRTSKLP